MPDQSTTAAKNRRIRQEALREQLSSQGHLQHVIDILNKVSNETQDVDRDMCARYKLVVDAKLKLIGKYLPDLKAIEISGDEDNPLQTITKVERVIVDTANTDS